MKRIIQVGVGGMGWVWTDRVAESKKWEAVAYVDVNAEVLAKAAERHHMPRERCFTNVDDALRNVEADALLDVTPQQFRRHVCCEAFRRGLHVISEKPLADTLRNAQAIVACAEEHGRSYMVAQNYRYQPIAQTVRRLLESGRLGEVGYVGVNFHKGPHFGGYREQMDFPLILDMSIHHFDLMRCLFGSDIRAVQGASISTSWNWNKGDATVMAQLELENGLCINYFASWVASGAETPWNADWRIECERGAILWEKDRLWLSDTPDKRRRVRLVKMAKTHQAYLLEAFSRALNEGSEPETSGRLNLNSLASTYAAVQAVKEGRRVLVSELLQ